MGRGWGARGGTNGHGDGARPRPLTLQADALAAPMFRETWSAGAPLDWADFLRQCAPPPPRRRRRADHGDRER